MATVVLGTFRLRHVLGYAPLATTLGGLQAVALLLGDDAHLRLSPSLAISPVAGTIVPAIMLALLVTHVREGTHRARELLVGLVTTVLVVGLLVAAIGEEPPLAVSFATLIHAVLLFVDALLVLLTYEIVGRMVRPLAVRVTASLALVLHADAMVASTLRHLGDVAWFDHLIAALAGATVGTAIFAAVGTWYLQRFEDRAWTWVKRNQPVYDLLPILTLRQRFAPLRTDTMRDAESGVYTRIFFEDSLPIEFDRAQQYGRQTSLVLIEVEPQPTDRAARDLAEAVGRALLEALRMTDVPCRYDENRYAAILPGADRAAAEASAGRLASLLAERRSRDQLPAMRLAYGVACYPDDGDRVVDLLQVAARRLDRKASARPADPLAAM